MKDAKERMFQGCIIKYPHAEYGINGVASLNFAYKDCIWAGESDFDGLKS